MKSLFYSMLLLLFCSPVFADPALGTREVLLDNETVQVIRLTYPAGTESGMHTHEFSNRVVYFIKGGSLELVPADELAESDTLIVGDGEAVYLPAVTHNVKNIGDDEIVILEVEIK